MWQAATHRNFPDNIASNLSNDLLIDLSMNACKSSLVDIFDLIKMKDFNLVKTRFASVDSTKVPPMSADSKDVGLLREEIKALKERIVLLPNKLEELGSLKEQMHDIVRM